MTPDTPSERALMPPDDAWLPDGTPEVIGEHIMHDTPRGLSESYYAKLIALAIHRERRAFRAAMQDIDRLTPELAALRAERDRLRVITADARTMTTATLAWLGSEFPNHPPREDLRFLESDLRHLEKEARAALAGKDGP